MSGVTLDTKRVFWHRELPPVQAEVVGTDAVEATSHHVSDTLDHRSALWDDCLASLKNEATHRIHQEISRLGADCAHVVHEEIDTRRHDPTGAAWLHGRFEFVIYRLVSTLVLLLTTLMSASCGPTPPIALRGSLEDVTALAGEWQGAYDGGRRGRSGSIVFTLAAGEDHAHGDVVMIPAGAELGYFPYSGYPTRHGSAVTPHALTIWFVSVQSGRVSGTLDRYWDPDANCAAVATFRGRRDGDVMQGTFESACDDGSVPSTGRWRVARRQR